MFDADRRRPEAPRPSARPERFVASRGVRLEPVHALPARFLAKSRAELGQPRVHGRETKRTPRGALMPRVLDVVVRRVDLVSPGERVVAACVMATEATRVHLPRVELRAAVYDPLGDQPAHAARAGEAVRAEARRDPE